MQWKEERTDVFNKIVKNIKPVPVKEIVKLNENFSGENRNVESLSNNIDQEIYSNNIDQEIHSKEVDRTNIGRSSSRPNKSTISRNKDFLW